MARVFDRGTTTGTTHASSSTSIGAGVGAGVIAAIVMGLIAMIVSAATGNGFWTPMQLIGALLLRDDWMASPVWAGLLGIVTHLAVGAGWGAVFAMLTRRVHSFAIGALIGLAFATAVFLFMTYLVLPWANPFMYGAVDHGRFFLYHLAYGLTLAIALPMRERSSGSERTYVATRREAY